MAHSTKLRSILIYVVSGIVLTIAALFLLLTLFDIQIELAGNNLPGFLSFGNSSSHFDTLEENRSQHYSRLLPAAPIESDFRSSYWTDFRGPNRDGLYSQNPILTDWPIDGLPPVWHQPIGGGYGSFVIANGRAFTIEQRRNRETVAA